MLQISMTYKLLLPALALALPIAGCGGSTPAPRGPGTPAATAIVIAPALPVPQPAATSSVGSKGLAAADNDAAIVALVKAALDCPRNGHELLPGCREGFALYRALTVDGAAADRTLVNLLEDPDDRVRSIGIFALWSPQRPRFQPDKDLAGRVIAAAEKEAPTGAAAIYWGGVVAAIDFERAGVLARVAAMVKNEQLGEVRRVVVKRMLVANKQSPGAARLVMDMVKDPDPEMKLAALSAFSQFSGANVPEVCTFLLSETDDADDEVASRAAYALGEMTLGPRCAETVDGLLTSVEKRAVAKPNDNSVWGAALYLACTPSALDDAQRTRAAKLATTLAASRTAGDRLRCAALDAILRCDPTNGMARVTTYRKDKSELVRSHAESLLRPPVLP
jgi:hypothetical protein